MLDGSGVKTMPDKMIPGAWLSSLMLHINRVLGSKKGINAEFIF